MALRTVAGLFCVSLLMFGGIRSKADQIYHFSRAGENITLPCQRLSHHGPRCSVVEWSYYKTRASSITKVDGGEVLDSRLALNSDCSLSVPSVTKEDTGLFLCRQKDTYDAGTNVYLNVLTVSPAPPEPKSQSFTLQCTLWRYDGRTCSAGTLVWLDQNQEVLYEEQRNCESYLTVELQSPHSRTFTCQYKEEGKVQVSAEYSLMRERVQPEKGVDMIYIISGAVGCVLLLLLIAAAVLFYKIKSKVSTQTTEDIYAEPQPADSVVDPESNLTYATINHQKPKKQIVVEDTVTYSAVSIKAKEDSSHSALYSTVNKT